jgi:hypothetical protein
LLSGDLFDGHYRLIYTITLFSKIGNYFVNIHNEIRVARNGFTAVYNGLPPRSYFSAGISGNVAGFEC